MLFEFYQDNLAAKEGNVAARTLRGVAMKNGYLHRGCRHVLRGHEIIVGSDGFFVWLAAMKRDMRSVLKLASS